MAQVRSFQTSDNVKLVYSVQKPAAREAASEADGQSTSTSTSSPAVILLHGWSGSRRYFDLCVDAIAQECTVYALDQRFHGESDSPPYGFHVSRLAADLHEFIVTEKIEKPVVVGTSMGAAVIWSFIELYTDNLLGKAVFVDQAPLQNRSDDWTTGSNGCYDSDTLRNLQQALLRDMNDFADGNAQSCLSNHLPPDILELLKKETLRCNGKTLGLLMADHTHLDWRPTLPLIKIPCLNAVGEKSGIFPLEGLLYVGDHITTACNVIFQGCNHWLYLERPQQFAAQVVDLALHGLGARPKLVRVA